MKKQDGSTLAGQPHIDVSGGWQLHLVLSVLALLGTLSLFGFLLRQSHTQAVADATADATNLAKALERHFDSSLRRLDAM